MSDGNQTRSGQQDDGEVSRGQIGVWEKVKYRVMGRRAVDGFAMFQTSSHELFLVALDGGEGPGWVAANEVGPAAQ